ncbi:hypothetical protein [Budvicia aquatica]|uniref:Uncharacterized protein n=1 Tax=Budvicia aquatica TaxID=82979 RepID=A0A2C6DSA3_9GAMM|nr:hypothetical protein [Budvicia aquatica]PHI31691.1 hypothetical protein CRN84_21335 [Budvicia aquatica]VFS52444.1 Uncharacterised protein [Budvicia aquatica]
MKKKRILIILAVIAVCSYVGYKVYMRPPSESAMVTYAKEGIEKSLRPESAKKEFKDLQYVEQERTSESVMAHVCGIVTAIDENSGKKLYQERFIVSLEYNDTGRKRYLYRKNMLIPRDNDPGSIINKTGNDIWNEKCKK